MIKGESSLSHIKGKMKNIGKFFLLVCYAVGVLGGLGFALYGKGWFIAACIVVLGGMAFPTAKKLYKSLFE